MKKTEGRRQSSTGPGDTEGVQDVWPVAWGVVRDAVRWDREP